MVWIRSAPGSCSRFQPRAAPWRSAAAASARNCPAHGSSAALSPRSAWVTRARISAAALRVKVMARIAPGWSTVHSRRRKRCVSMEVLPDPAGACSRIERRGSTARSRASASARASSFLGGLGGSRGWLHAAGALADAADVDDVTVVAGSGTRVDGRLAGEKAADQTREEGPPGAPLLCPGIRGARRSHGPDRGQQMRRARDAIETHLARVHAHGGEGHHPLAEGFPVGEQLRMRRPLAVPIRAHTPPALVIEDRAPAAGEGVDAIDAHTQPRPRESELGVTLERVHAEGRAFALALA